MITKLKGLLIGAGSLVAVALMAVAGACEEVPVTVDTLISTVQADVSGTMLKVAGPAFIVFGIALTIGLLWRKMSKAMRAS